MTAPPTTAPPTLHPITPELGAEVRGIDLRTPPSPACGALLRSALHRHGLLVFREQHGIGCPEQIRLAECFGQPATAPAGLPSHPQVVRIVHDAEAPPTENIWHSDLSFLPEPPSVAVLRAVEVPPVGGDTLFADMRAAFRMLPAPLRDVLRSVTVRHDIATQASAELAGRLRAAVEPTVHPAVRVHPDTGDEILFVNSAYSCAVEELAPDRGAALLQMLCSRPGIPEVQCRVRWAPGTVVVWDNRSTQHYAVGDYLPARRVMDRITVGADPVTGQRADGPDPA